MENEKSYLQAVTLFEQKEYEKAVEIFIRLYENGYEKEMILQQLYSCFVLPNENEFKENYKKNSEGLCKCGFDTLLLDFIPVSDVKYYIFHRELHQFLGSIDISEEECPEQEAEVHSVLIADIWDLREMVPYIKMCCWNTCYILLDGIEREFLSFLKLPDIEQKYLKNAVVFLDIEMMEQFFIQYPEYYLPKEIVSRFVERYREILNGLHENRIKDTERKRENILLSVCIPSYGRGSILLANVQNLLQVEYDTEIEIVVSNNGSTEDVEGYEIVKNIQDSRITYYAFEENKGFPINVCKTLELANGQFAVFASDEDFMRIENLHSFLNYLINHRNEGVIYVAGNGPNFITVANMEFNRGIDSFSRAIGLNYMTGIVLNQFWVRENHVLDRVIANGENKFVQIYMHIALALLTVENTMLGCSDIVMWESMDEKENAEEGNAAILSYMHYESRIEQQNAAVEFIEKVMRVNVEEWLELVMNRIEKTYFLCEVGYETRAQAYKELIDWRELCRVLHQNNMKLLERYKGCLTDTGYLKFHHNIKTVFIKYVNRNPAASILSEQEQINYKIVGEIAKYQLNQGKEIMEIDYLDLEKKWQSFLENI